MGRKGFGSNILDEFEPELTPLQQFLKEKLGKVISQGDLERPVYLNNEKHPSPDELFTKNKYFAGWLEKRLDYAKREKLSLSHTLNLIRMYGKQYGWFAYLEEQEHQEKMIPMEHKRSIFDYE